MLSSRWLCHCSRSAARPYRIYSRSPFRPSACQQYITAPLKPRTFASKALTRPAPYDTPVNRMSKQPPTLLYQVESNVPYIVGCYFIGISLITCGFVNNGMKNLAVAADVPAYVPLFTAIGSFSMIAVGCWMLVRPQNLVKSVKSIPSTKRGSLLLQIERSRCVPLITPATMTVPYTDITTSEPFFLGGDQQIQAELKQLQRQEEYIVAFDKESILTLPFRQIGWLASVFFRGVKKAFTDEGLFKFHIRGKNFAWKMERSAAWAHENGRTLDSLVRIKQV